MSLYKYFKRKRQMGGNLYEDPYQQGQGVADAGVNAVSAINPVIGGALKLGQGIGNAARDEDGIYKSKAGEFFANSFDPTTGVQGLIDNFKDPSAEGILNQASLGLFGKSSAQERAERAKIERQRLRRNSLAENLNNSNLVGYNTSGNTSTSIYEKGGWLKPLNSDTVEVQGNTHAEGGVQLPAVNAEVEDKETIAKDYVFSDYLGFAEPHKRIAKQIGKIEKKPLNNERRVSLEILRKKEAALRNAQETVKQELKGSNMMQMGGRLPRYSSDYDVPVMTNELTTGQALTEPQGTPPVTPAPKATLEDWRMGRTEGRNWSMHPLTVDEIQGWNTELINTRKQRDLVRYNTQQRSKKPSINTLKDYYSSF